MWLKRNKKNCRGFLFLLMMIFNPYSNLFIVISFKNDTFSLSLYSESCIILYINNKISSNAMY